MIYFQGKMVAGHNMFLDIIHTLQQFLYPLPEVSSAFDSTVILCLSVCLD